MDTRVQTIFCLCCGMENFSKISIIQATSIISILEQHKTFHSIKSEESELCVVQNTNSSPSPDHISSRKLGAGY